MSGTDTDSDGDTRSTASGSALPSRAAFVRAFDRRPADERAALVADLLAARGDVVERDGRRVVATRDGTTRRVRVGRVDDAGAAANVHGVDEVVVRSRHGSRRERVARVARVVRVASPVGGGRRPPASGATAVDAATVYRRLRYAIDRETAAGIVDAHLGRVPEPRERRLPAGGRRVAGVVAVLAVTVAVVVAGVGGGGVAEWPAGSSTPTPTPTATAVDRSVASASTATGPPPGVTADGVDVERLTAAHLDALGGRASMDATFAGPRFLTGFDTYRTGYSAGDEVAIRVRVASPDRYHVVRRTRFPGDLRPRSASTLERYADGVAEYRRIVADDDAPRYDRRSLATARGGVAEVDGWTRTLLPRYLTTTERRVDPLDGTRVAADAAVERSDSRRYRIVATGTPRRLDHDAGSYRAVAVVAADGFVDALEVEYVHPPTGATVRVTVDYARERVTVDAPPWYDAAVAATDGSARVPGVGPRAGVRGARASAPRNPFSPYSRSRTHHGHGIGHVPTADPRPLQEPP